MNLQTLLLITMGLVIIYLNIATDERLEYDIEVKFGMRCNLENVCGDMAEISCQPSAGGPIHYVYKDNLAIIETCNAGCVKFSDKGCRNCPPVDYKCESEWFESRN